MIKQADLVIDKKTGLWIRPATFDYGIAAERRVYVPLNIQKGDVVLDIGGNIGGTADLFLSSGAGFVVTIEPDPDNFTLLFWNLEGISNKWQNLVDYEAIQAAVMPDSFAGAQTDLYINEAGTNKALHSTVPIRGRPSVKVDVLRWSDLMDKMERLRCNVAKIDIEGAEYELPVWDLPATVRALAIELHLARPAFQKQAVAYDRRIQEAGFKPMRELAFSTKARAALMIYHREPIKTTVRPGNRAEFIKPWYESIG